MGELFDSFLASREKVAASKRAISLVRPSPSKMPIQSLLPHSSLVDSWNRTAEKLLPLGNIFEWVTENNPGLYESLVKFESLCVLYAKEGNGKNFATTKRQYLSALGRVCELYYADTWQEDIEFLSPGLGMKRIFLTLNEKSPTTIPVGSIVFYVREFPSLVASTPQEISDLCVVKEGIPGAAISVET